MGPVCRKSQQQSKGEDMALGALRGEGGVCTALEWWGPGGSWGQDVAGSRSSCHGAAKHLCAALMHVCAFTRIGFQ